MIRKHSAVIPLLFIGLLLVGLASHVLTGKATYVNRTERTLDVVHVGKIAPGQSADASWSIDLEGPVIDDETGRELYRIRHGEHLHGSTINLALGAYGRDRLPAPRTVH